MKNLPSFVRFVSSCAIIGLMLYPYKGFCQPRDLMLEDHEVFFSKIPAQYRIWLSESGLYPIIGMDTVQIKGNILVLKFSMPDKKNWLQLDSFSQVKGWRDLASELFEQALFFSDLSSKYIRLKIEGIDAVVTVEPDLNNQGLAVYFTDKMGEVSDFLLFSVGNLKLSGITNIEQLIQQPLAQLKTKIQVGLAQFFKEKNRSWFQDSRLEVISNYRNDEMVIRVTNIKGVVLDLNYFEYLRLSFHFSGADKQLKLSYTVTGKYGAGILWTPFESDYNPMSPVFDPALTQFSSEILKTEIAKILAP